MGATDVGTNREAIAKVVEWIDATSDELIAFVQAYVRHPSVNPGRAMPGDPTGTKACQEWLRAQLVDFGDFDSVDMWDGAPDEPNVVAVVRGAGKDGRSLMFNGHTDTVGVGPEQRAQWLDGDPWSARIVDGKLYGRGSTDMKAGNAAFLWAARAVRALGLRPRADVQLSMTIGEETGEPELGPFSVLDRGYGADLLVNAEGTGLQVCPAAIGFFFFKVSIEGKSLHPAGRHRSIYPQRRDSPFPPGVDAVEKTRKLMDALTRLEQDWALYQQHPLMEPGNMNLCLVSIQGGGYRGAMPERCEVVYAVVYNPSLTGDQVMTEIRQAIDGVVRSDTWLRTHPPEIAYPVLHQVLEPVNLPVDHPGTRALAAAFGAALGREPELGCITSPGDANLFASRGQPTIILGPGDFTCGVHGTNEFVPVQQVIDAAKVYAAMIVAWCGVVDTTTAGGH